MENQPPCPSDQQRPAVRCIVARRGDVVACVLVTRAVLRRHLLPGSETFLSRKSPWKYVYRNRYKKSPKKGSSFWGCKMAWAFLLHVGNEDIRREFSEVSREVQCYQEGVFKKSVSKWYPKVQSKTPLGFPNLSQLEDPLPSFQHLKFNEIYEKNIYKTSIKRWCIKCCKGMQIPILSNLRSTDQTKLPTLWVISTKESATIWTFRSCSQAWSKNVHEFQLICHVLPSQKQCTFERRSCSGIIAYNNFGSCRSVPFSPINHPLEHDCWRKSHTTQNNNLDGKVKFRDFHLLVARNLDRDPYSRWPPF